MKKSWYKMQAKAGTPKAAEITIFDEIGFWGVTAAAFLRELKALGDVETIDVLINSPGGSVFDGLAIYNALRQHKATVNVTVMGVAASAASFIAMAGDKITMPENAFLMVHNAMGGVFGNAQEIRDWADTLDKIGASLIGIYVARTGKSEADVKALLDAETWMTAKEALDLGFADEVIAEMKIAASFDLESHDNLPKAALAAFKAAAEPPPDPEDVDPEHADPEQGELFAEEAKALVTAAGFEAFALDFALACKTIDEVKARIAVAGEVKALCALAKANADTFIRDGKSLDEVRAALIDSRASGSEATHVSTTPRNPASPAPTQPSAVKATTADIWAKRRNPN